MITAKDILQDAFDRVHELLPGVVEGLTTDELLYRPDAEANPIGWLVWHLTRVQDDHVAGVGGTEQLWTGDGWADRFALPYPPSAIGYGQTSDEVGAFRVEGPELLTGYHAAVHRRTTEVLEQIDDAGLARIVDERFDPPVTAAARLVSVVNDIGQHVGQAGYLRGLVERRR